MIHLPIENIYLILRFLDFRSLCSLGQCSKRLYTLCNDDVIWKRLYEKRVRKTCLEFCMKSVDSGYKKHFSEILLEFRGKKWELVHSERFYIKCKIQDTEFELDSIKTRLHWRSKPSVWKKVREDKERQRKNLDTTYNTAKKFVNLYNKLKRLEGNLNEREPVNVADYHIKKYTSYRQKSKGLRKVTHSSKVRNMVHGLEQRADYHFDKIHTIIETMEMDEREKLKKLNKNAYEFL